MKWLYLIGFSCCLMSVIFALTDIRQDKLFTVLGWITASIYALGYLIQGFLG